MIAVRRGSYRRVKSLWAFGDAIGARREELGIATRTEAAELIGIARQTYMQLEKGSRQYASPEIVRKIATAFQMDATQLLALAKYGDRTAPVDTNHVVESASPISGKKAWRCENCLWWDNKISKRLPYPNNNGFCRISPPRSSKNEVAYWPLTNNDDWCGSFLKSTEEDLL